MAAQSCPHCQASLDEPVVFCGTCGRRVEGWEGEVRGGAGPLADGAALTRRAEIDSTLRRAIARSTEKEKEKQAAGDDPGRTQPLPASVRETEPSMAAAARPRMIRGIAVVAGAGILAFGGVVGVYRMVRKPATTAAAAVAAPAVVVNLEQPVEHDEPPAIASTSKKKRKLYFLPDHHATYEVKVKAGAEAAKPAATAVTGSATPPPTPPTNTSPSPPTTPVTPTNTSTSTSTSPSPSTDLPEDLPDEEAPPTEQELAERAKAAAYADNIRFVLRAHRAQVLACYERTFKEEGTSPGGRVTIDFTIGTDGKAHKVQTSGNSTGKEMLSRCLEQRLQEWEFPKPAEEFATSFPFVFSAGG